MKRHRIIVDENNLYVRCSRRCPSNGYSEMYSITWGHYCKPIGRIFNISLFHSFLFFIKTGVDLDSFLSISSFFPNLSTYYQHNNQSYTEIPVAQNLKRYSVIFRVGFNNIPTVTLTITFICLFFFFSVIPEGCLDEYCNRCLSSYKWVHSFKYQSRCVKTCPKQYYEYHNECESKKFSLSELTRLLYLLKIRNLKNCLQ